MGLGKTLTALAAPGDGPPGRTAASPVIGAGRTHAHWRQEAIALDC